MSFFPTLGKYGILLVMALIPPLDAFVFGAMAMALGVSDKPFLALIQALAAMAIVAIIGREDLLRGAAAAAGMVAGAITYTAVGDVFLQAFGQTVGSILVGVFDFIIRGFLLGLAVGIALVVSPLSVLSAIAGFLLALTIAVIGRALDLLEAALETAIGALYKGLPMGVMALTAPYIGGVMVALPLAFGVIMLATIIAIALGVAVGIFIMSIILGYTVIFTIIGLFSLILFLFGATLVALLRIAKTSFMSPMVDVLVFVLFPFLGPALYTAGFAGLLTRRKALGAYLIGLGLFGTFIPIKLPI